MTNLQPLTKETIDKTRQYYIDNALARIKEEEQGRTQFPVNDFDLYKQQCLEDIEQIKAGLWDSTFTFWQKAYYIQTGKCIPLLPKTE